MLDFYRVDDEETDEVYLPEEYPPEERYIGGLTMDSFAEIRRFGLIPDRPEFEGIDFHNDFHVGSVQLRTLLDYVTKRRQVLELTPGFRSVAIERFVSILETAIKEGSAFCD